eukprot:362687-Pyramimonas_sp.AAC.1
MKGAHQLLAQDRSRAKVRRNLNMAGPTGMSKIILSCSARIPRARATPGARACESWKRPLGDVA